VSAVRQIFALFDKYALLSGFNLNIDARNESGERFQGYAVPLPLCPSSLWSGTLVRYPLLSSAGLVPPLCLVVPGAPCCPFLARAAAANVNTRTRLSNVTEIPPLLVT
jgi:hypothetical protein